jgi:hypothetical protein
VERPFYSPQNGQVVLFSQQFRKDTIQGADLTYVKQNFKFSFDFGLEKHFNFLKIH